MGLPIKTLVCASNSNNVLTDFLKTGTYDKNRKFYTTTSPSMDILISSNLERLLYHMSDGDDKLIVDLMNKLSKDGNIQFQMNLLLKFKRNLTQDTQQKKMLMIQSNIILINIITFAIHTQLLQLKYMMNM